jgi:predicted enzyme related to lactoylglutathione lyase
MRKSVAFYRKLGLKQIVDSPRTAMPASRPGRRDLLGPDRPRGEIAPTTAIYFECDDLDSRVERLARSGLVFEHGPRNQPWMWREARLRDPAGNIIFLYKAGEARRFPPWRMRAELTPGCMQPSETEIEVPFDAALSERYLVYALSTITARSLPDVRDGLKPVHRRLLWAMRLLRLDPAGAYKKSARVVGDVIGKYHPHGDQSVYDAMVRLAQSFALRYPLVDGQGNFGNIDGDNAAAYRYTEARLTPIATQLMAGLDEGTVDFRPTYNGEEEEPEVFPGLFPNLLANGASGIAVGMATSIPPHNVGELIDAAMHLIDNPKAETAT